MANPLKSEMSDLEREIQERFNPNYSRKFSSTAREASESKYVQDLVLPENSRGRLPLTREDFVVEENPARVEWERQVRKFLARLNPEFGHRITGPMIYEWATGISIKELQEAEGATERDPRGGGQLGSANAHLRHINAILRDYFGTPKKTSIMGRSIGRAYTVRPWFRVKNKKPMCLTLWPEWQERTLDQ